MTQELINIRRAYSRDEMLALKEIVADGIQYFVTKYPINMPFKCRVRTKNTSTCSTHNVEETSDFRGSKSSLAGGSREQSDTEDLGNNGWRRVANNRGSSQSQSHNLQRFPSGSSCAVDQSGQQQQPLWRQRTNSGSDRQFDSSHSRGRGFYNRGRGAYFGANEPQNFKNDSNFKPRGGLANRGFGRGRGSFNRNSYGSEHSNENGNFRHSYHASGDQAQETFWNEDDWTEETNEKAPPPGLKTEPPKEPEQPIWIYIDPQDKVQGPFTSNAMSQWLELGYLPNNLQLRKVTDPDFTSLDNLIAVTGQSDPFKETGPEAPPIPDTMALISKFSPKEVETHFMKFAESHYGQTGDPMLITESLLKLNMADIFRCLSDEAFLTQKIEELLPKPAVKKTFKKCALNEGDDGFHFEIASSETVPVVHEPEKVAQPIEELAEQLQENAKLSSEPESAAVVQAESKKLKKKKRTSATTAAEPVKANPVPELEEDEAPVDKGWISAPAKVPKPLGASNDSASGKKKKKTKKSETEAWEAEMNRRKQEQLEKRERELAEEAEYKRELLEQERQAQLERMTEAQQAAASLQNREQRWQNTNLGVVGKSEAPPPGMPKRAPAVPNFAQIQAEQLAEEARRMELRLKELQSVGQKAASNVLRPTGWASVAAANSAPAVPVMMTAKKPVSVAAKPVEKPKELPPAETKRINGHGGKTEELRVWCQNQLSHLPPINSAIDLPTVTSLVCDMNDKAQVTEFIENSFGSSKKVKKFVQDLMQRKAKST